jgi:hypothetical protein
MLRVSIHAGSPAERSVANQLAVLDIAYLRRAALADYSVTFAARGAGEFAPAVLANYPRWSASLWDLTARALTQALYRRNDLPAFGSPDRRCAYARRICAVVLRATADDFGLELASADIEHTGTRRGRYRARFAEDVMGAREVEFEYGVRVLQPADLLLRAICWAWTGKETLPPMPTLIVPPALRIDGEERFHIEALTEPARTGFIRHMGGAVDVLPRASDYVAFISAG